MAFPIPRTWPSKAFLFPRAQPHILFPIPRWTGQTPLCREENNGLGWTVEPWSEATGDAGTRGNGNGSGLAPLSHAFSSFQTHSPSTH